MLCHRCRRATALALQQLSRPALLTTKAPLIGARPVPSSTPTPVAPSRLSTLPRPILQAYYSTAAEGAATTPPTGPAKPDYLNAAEAEIWDKLATAFTPTELMVQDVSGGCGSMYGIEIASEKFRGANMLKQQRMVNEVLGEQLKQWHGVQLRTKVPA